MSKIRDISGMKFNRLTAISIHGRDKKKCVTWLCKCDCGNEAIVRASRLTTGNTKSCGCRLIEIQTSKCKKHGYAVGNKAGHKLPPTYISWIAMKGRCTDPHHISYPAYGAVGINICKDWLASFEAFLFDMGERPLGHMLDRIDGTKGYCKENCRWVTPSESSRNTRQNVWIEHNGKRQILADWASSCGISAAALSKRIKSGWPLEEALNSPSLRNKQVKP